MSSVIQLFGGVPTELHIAGSQLPAASGARFDVIDPSTGAVLTSVANADIDDAMAALDAAESAAAEWATTPPRRRAEVLRAAYELMSSQAEQYAQLISAENGKALADARGEVAYAAEFFRWYSEEAVRISGTLSIAPSGTNRIMVSHQPVGICVLVTPWNFPAAMATRKIGPALAAGCSMILKPASDTPLTALAMVQTLETAGVPAGVVNVLPSRRSGPVVSAILHDPRVRKLSFTGSTEVGRVLLREAAEQIVNSSMELGGNAPFLVFDDADLDAALDGAMVAKMRNAGEACTAANRFYVQSGVAEQFSAGLAQRMAALLVGPAGDEQTNVGPLINAEAVAKVGSLVDDAVERGARPLLGGGPPQGKAGFFYNPTVLVDVASDSAILGEEIFGPVAPIVSFEDERSAIELANATEYGLVAYLYTRDIGRGLRVADQLEAGMVGINRGLVSDPAAPFGGVKQSGIGREGGHEGVLDYTESRYVAVQW